MPNFFVCNSTLVVVSVNSADNQLLQPVRELYVEYEGVKKGKNMHLSAFMSPISQHTKNISCVMMANSRQH